jgi:hypothetical protein
VKNGKFFSTILFLMDRIHRVNKFKFDVLLLKVEVALLYDTDVIDLKVGRSTLPLVVSVTQMLNLAKTIQTSKTF